MPPIMSHRAVCGVPARVVGGHAAIAAIFTTAWEVAIHLPQGEPGTALEAVGLVPWLVAGLSLALIARAEQMPAEAAPAPQVPVQARPAVVRPKELTR